jgi:hypothetical protein
MVIPRQEYHALADALDEAGPAERASATRVVVSALIQLLPQEERLITLDFLNQRSRGQVS